jgi:hypothetical protein
VCSSDLGWQTYHLHVPIVLKSESLSLLEFSGPVQACNEIALPFLYTLYVCQSSNLYSHCTDGVFFISCRLVQLVLLQSKPRESPVVIMTSGVWCPKRAKILLLPSTSILALNATHNDGSFRHNKGAETWCWYLTSVHCLVRFMTCCLIKTRKILRYYGGDCKESGLGRDNVRCVSTLRKD